MFIQISIQIVLENLRVFYENGRTGCRLAEQIHNKIKRFTGFDIGTDVTLLGKPNFVILVGDIYKLVSIPKMHQAQKASF